MDLQMLLAQLMPLVQPVELVAETPLLEMRVALQDLFHYLELDYLQA
jgi:hypothetical protein